MDKLRTGFREGLDALTKFVFERTRPKQVGATMMTGPVLVGITESYLKALNEGAVPTISSSWQVNLKSLNYDSDLSDRRTDLTVKNSLDIFKILGLAMR